MATLLHHPAPRRTLRWIATLVRRHLPFTFYAVITLTLIGWIASIMARLG
jgi:hypothetical protein